MRTTILIATLILATFAFAQNETVLYSFHGGTDGQDPMAGLIADQAGNLYGTTYYGGDSNCSFACGIVFELSPPSAPGGQWTENVLYTFKGGADGANPQGGLVFDSAGNLYGTTAAGGSGGPGCPGNGCGTVFELSPPSLPGGAWTETVLYRFLGSHDGADPAAGVIFDGEGRLYGTTANGGNLLACAGGCGTVFQLSPPSSPGGTWTETVLKALGENPDGARPVAGLIFDGQGNLYGTTEGGTHLDTQFGTVFELSPPAVPGGSWTETLLYAFHGSDGSAPTASLIFDPQGNVYGTTLHGGTGFRCRSGCGTAYELSPPSVPGGPWTEKVLFNFEAFFGAEPAAALVFDSLGNLFGTTQFDGGGGATGGTAFQLTPPVRSGGAWRLTSLHVFPGGSGDGANPLAPLLRAPEGVFYGTTMAGGTADFGSVYSLAVAPFVNLSPANLSFGNQTVNFVSSPQPVTLANAGNSLLTITNIQLTGDNTTDFAQTNNCKPSLPPAASCTFQVTFTPSATGPRNAAILITDNAQNGQQSVPLTGNGVLPAVTFNPTSLTFPPQLVFTKSKAQKVTLTNSGLGVLAISSVQLTGSDFRQSNNCDSQQIAPGGSCSFSITFQPTVKGKFTGSIAVTDNAPDSPESFALTGTGTVILVNPTSLNFGTQPVNTTSLPLTVTLTNKGHQAVSMEKFGFVGGAASNFAQTNTCGTSLASGASCFVNVTFTPNEKGYRKATLEIEDTGGGSPQQVSLEGYGT
jgi:uncharacterized repeat protein (TIGR03803 family)